MQKSIPRPIYSHDPNYKYPMHGWELKGLGVEALIVNVIYLGLGTICTILAFFNLGRKYMTICLGLLTFLWLLYFTYNYLRRVQIHKEIKELKKIPQKNPLDGMW